MKIWQTEEYRTQLNKEGFACHMEEWTSNDKATSNAKSFRNCRPRISVKLQNFHLLYSVQKCVCFGFASVFRFLIIFVSHTVVSYDLFRFRWSLYFQFLLFSLHSSDRDHKVSSIFVCKEYILETAYHSVFFFKMKSKIKSSRHWYSAAVTKNPSRYLLEVDSCLLLITSLLCTWAVL